MMSNFRRFFSENSILNLFLLALIFFIPLAWSKYLNANYVSAKYFLYYVVSSLTLLVSFRRLILPQLPKFLWAALAGISILHFLSPALTGNWYDLMYLGRFLGFCFFSYYFFTLRIKSLDEVYRKVTYAIFLVIALIVVFAAWDFYKFRIELMSIQSGYLLGSFGNVNMMAEFLVLTVAFVFHWTSFKDRVPYWVKMGLFALWIFFIMYCRSRSTWLGLIAWALWQLWQRKRIKEVIGVFILSVSMYFAAMHLPYTEDGIDFKKDSLKERVNLYRSTGQMIVENPLGFGIAHFDNFLVPYQLGSEGKPNEYLHYDQPHSEIFRWTTQLGWLGMLFGFIFMGFAAWILLFKRKAIESVEVFKDSKFLIESVLLLAPQMIFQFPFHNPTSLVYLAFLLGLFLSLFPTAKNLALTWKSRLPIALLALVGVINGVAFVTSIFYESVRSDDASMVAFACDIYPINQNACFLKTYHILKAERYLEARPEFQRSFGNFVYHRGLLRILPTYLKYTAGDQASCESVHVYQLLFPEQKFFDAQVIKSCAGFSTPIKFENPKQFDRDYRYWLNRQLQ